MHNTTLTFILGIFAGSIAIAGLIFGHGTFGSMMVSSGMVILSAYLLICNPTILTK